VVNPVYAPQGKQRAEERYKKRMAACNGTHSLSRFEALRKEADLYRGLYLQREKKLYEQGRSVYREDCELGWNRKRKPELSIPSMGNDRLVQGGNVHQ
jgi:hypothetical protein